MTRVLSTRRELEARSSAFHHRRLFTSIHQQQRHPNFVTRPYITPTASRRGTQRRCRPRRRPSRRPVQIRARVRLAPSSQTLSLTSVVKSTRPPLPPLAQSERQHLSDRSSSILRHASARARRFLPAPRVSNVDMRLVHAKLTRPSCQHL